MKINPFIPVEDETEVFLPVTDDMVPGVKDIYSVSNYGRVYSSASGKFIGSHDEDGYIRSDLIKNDKSKIRKGNHTLMMLAFRPIDNYNPNKDIPNHLDGIKDHNTLDNLEWTDTRGNSLHAIDTGLHKMNGEDNPNNKLSRKDVEEICKLIETGQYYDTEIANMYGVSYTNISDIHKGKIWKDVSKDYDMTVKKYKSLTPEKAREICELLSTGEYTISEISKKVGVSEPSVSGIKNGSSWREISKDYDLTKVKVKKFTESDVRQMCEEVQSGLYFDTEIAKMHNTTPTFLRDLRIGKVWRNVTKDYDMTVRKQR